MEFNATFLVSTVSFILFTIIMNAIFYKPLQKIVLEREKFIEETNEDARIASEKSENLLKDKEQKLEQSRETAKKLILSKTEEAKGKKADMAHEAQREAAAEIEGAKNDLHRSKEEAQAALADETTSIAAGIAAKILG